MKPSPRQTVSPGRRRWRTLRSGTGLVALLAFAGVAPAQSNVDDALRQLQPYRFGSPRTPIDVVEQAVTASLSDPVASSALAAKLAALLATDASYDSRQFVCRQLVLIATENEVPALTRLLAEDSLAPLALYVLKGARGPAVDEALRQALPGSTGRTRLGILDVLGHRADPGSAPAIAPLLQADDETAAAAAAALGRLPSEVAAEALRTALRTAPAGRRPPLTEALLQSGETFLARDRERVAREIYRGLESDPDPETQAAALRGLLRSRDPAAVRKVLGALRQERTPLQRMAAGLLRELPEVDLTLAAAQDLPGLPPASQILFLEALADGPGLPDLTTVHALARQAEPPVRTAALGALGSIGTAASVPPLLACAAGATAEEQQAAQASLAALSGPTVDAALTSQARTAAAPCRVMAMRALGARGAAEAVPALLDNAADPDPQIRTIARQVLRDLAPPETLGPLVRQLVQAPAPERPSWLPVLAAVMRRMPEEGQRTADLLEALVGTPDAALRSVLLEALGNAPSPRALEALRQALGDPDPGVRQAALRPLADWPDDAPLPDLLAVARSTTDDPARTVALRGAIRLIGAHDTRPPAEALSLYRETVSLARRPEEKRLVVAGLATLRTLEALEFAEAQAGDPGVREEAQMAMVEIARGTVGNHPGRTRAALQPIADSSSNPTARARASALLEFLKGVGDFVITWQVSPAYSEPGLGCAQLFDRPFAPELPDQAGRVAWRPLPVSTNAEQPWLLDLLAVHGGEQRVAYLRTWLDAERAREVVLELGSDDGLKVWMNGLIVHSQNTMRAVAPDQGRCTAALRPGTNELLLKVTQNNLGWGACVRVREKDGGPAAGLRARIP